MQALKSRGQRNMKPSKLKKGVNLLFKFGSGTERKAVFIRRDPAQNGQPAKNHIQFPDYIGMDGPDDQGICLVSDYELSRKGRLA